MKLTKKNEIKKHIVWVLLLCAAFLLQTTYGFMPHIFHAKLLPLLPLLGCICMAEKEKCAPWYGLFCGLLMDVTSPSMVGYNALILMLICTFIGWVSTNYLRNTLLTNLVMGSVLIFLGQSLYWLFFIEFKQTDGAGLVYLTVFLPTILMNMILIIPFFFLVLAIGRKLKKEEQV